MYYVLSFRNAQSYMVHSLHSAYIQLYLDNMSVTMAEF